MPDFYEFFAGGGMARAGLGKGWRCLFANDFDHKKSATYRRNWEGGEELKTGDVRAVKPEDLPGHANLIWGSFPCQDLSLAGAGAGLKGDRSGTFWPFWEVVKGLISQGRAPEIITLENVCGTLHSHDGKDFEAICSALWGSGYRFGAVVIDAALFLPHSRPRLFVIGLREGLTIPDITLETPSPLWHSRALMGAFEKLPSKLKEGWVWWGIPEPKPRTSTFGDLVEDEPTGVEWHSPSETRQLLAMMSEVNQAKVKAATAKSKKTGKRLVGTIYKRTRKDEDGFKVQRAEVRFDDVAGCLRTPAGGSSRQLIVVIDGARVRSRLISSRETARLMGLPDHYELPANYNEAYHLTGDGVAVPVVRHLAQFLFEPLLAAQTNFEQAAI